MKRPNFDRKTARSVELREEIRALWNDPWIRFIVRAVAWSQIPVGFGLIIGCYLSLMSGSFHGVTVIALLGGLLLGLMAVGGLFHDGWHGATFYDTGLDKRVGKVLAWIVSDVCYGIPGYYWAPKHEFHHTETNIHGWDGDLDIEPALRLHPASRLINRINRYQHLYAWPLYLLMQFNMEVRGLSVALKGGKHGEGKIKPAHDWGLAGTLIGLVVFYGWAYVLPIWQFGWIALPCILAVVLAMGFFYACLFQFAHAVDDVAFLTVAELWAHAEKYGRKEGYVHQMEVTSDFASQNKVLGYLGAGLTNQVSHHLFKLYPFPFYWYTQKVVESWALRHGVVYHKQRTLWGAFRSHYNHLKKMGQMGVPFKLEMG